MGHRRNLRTLVSMNLIDLHHEWHVAIFFKPFGNMFFLNGRCKRAEAFTSFDLRIQDVLHVRAARITDNRAIAERARAPFEPALEPADNIPFGDMIGCPLGQRLIIKALHGATGGGNFSG